MPGSAGAVAAALNHAHESSRLSAQRTREHKNDCKKLVADFDTTTATAEQTHDYTACTEYLRPPKPESHSSIGMWFGITVTSIWLIGGAIFYFVEKRKPAQ